MFNRGKNEIIYALVMLFAITILCLNIYQIVQIFRTAMSFDENDCKGARDNFTPVFYVTVISLLLIIPQVLFSSSKLRAKYYERA